ncbi:PREDICTED: 28S ribosomal protein S14, mitochondrial [Ceratosolen solmsi marchali]|uniref:28S ribosomal protein S14, mitochondrial n=1 Tax=Ceratosolen solmsi marchali TaxID=326594 RepID=A0AAJ6YRE1_9HYME|nr:PREDICTED: 28S ribosomal protein S14, mitochondrial [Ceratosolen solmsi marchali]
MAVIFTAISRMCNNSTVIKFGLQQVRSLYTKPKTLRDIKRRNLVKEFAVTRLRYVAMKRNNILPKSIQDLASEAFNDIPRQSALRQLTPRCVITSRAYGTVHRWRLSRFVFRHLADYNKLCGVQRAMW